jgi:hypothetical protein
LERAAFAEYEEGLTPEEYAFLHQHLLKDAKGNGAGRWSPAKRWALTHRLKRKWDAHRKTT